MPKIPKTGFQILPGGAESHVDDSLAFGPSMIGVLKENVTWVQRLAERADPARTKIYYKDLPDWSLWFNQLADLSPEDAVTLWWDKARKDDHSLDDIIGWATANGHRPVIGAFGEPPNQLLDDPTGLRKFAAFELARAERTWEQGGMASVIKFSTGTPTRERVGHIRAVLDACRWQGDREPFAVLCIDEYAAIWPTGWMGPNQTDGLRDPATGELPPDITNDQKWEAYLQSPFLDFGDPQAWRPAWLVGRPWGLRHKEPDGSISYGIPELYDVLMMLGEGLVDTVAHPEVPKRGRDGDGGEFGGWWTCRGAWNERLGISQSQNGLRNVLEMGDDFYSRLRLPNGDLQAPWRMWFGGGPGHADHWQDYDLFRSASSTRMYLEDYGPSPQELPPPLVLEPGEPPPPPQPPLDLEQGLAEILSRIDGLTVTAEELADEAREIGSLLDESDERDP